MRDYNGARGALMGVWWDVMTRSQIVREGHLVRIRPWPPIIGPLRISKSATSTEARQDHAA
jgi:hypothetical protein